MPIVKVQYRKQFASMPSIGSWGVMNTGWFETDATTLTTAQRNIMQRFFDLAGPVGTLTDQWFHADTLDHGAGASTLSLWQYSAPTTTHLVDYPVTYPGYVGATPKVTLPSQAAISVGFRHGSDAVVQRGRTRFWFGPFALADGSYNTSPGGLRLRSSTVDTIAGNVADTLALLRDTHGWSFMVREGPIASSTFTAPDVLYVDDVIDVMRSRRAWRTYQARLDL